MVLLSSAQFAKNAVVIYSTVCRGKRQDFCKIYCYPAHNSEKFTGFLGLLSAAHFRCRAKIKVVMYGTFPKILPAFPMLLFAAHFLGGGLLFSAQFTVCIISFLQRRVLLFTAHFAKNHCLAYLPCCYSRHNSRKNFCWSCYSAHNSAKILLLPGRLLVSTQFQEFSPGVVIHGTILFFAKFPIFLPLLLFAAQFPQKSFLDFWVLESSAQFEWFPEFQKSRLWGCYSAHSSQNPPNRHRTILAQKIIFSGCYARHIVALRTKQLLFTAHRSWNPRHISVVIFDTATHYF